MSNVDFSVLGNWAAGHTIELIITAILLVTYIVLDLLTAPQLEAGAEHGGFKGATASRTIKAARTIALIVCLLLLSLIWGVQLSAVFVFATTTLTLLGVALFAQWSLISNITAYFILTLHPSFARGNYIRVMDGDNYVEGVIADLNLFSTKLISDNREVIMYPNILLLGRPAQINPKERMSSVGKIGGAKKDAKDEAVQVAEPAPAPKQ